MKKMIRFALPLMMLAVFSVVAFSSCNNPRGKMYKSESNYKKTMEFLQNNTVLIKSDADTNTTVATYRVHGKIIIVTTPAAGTPGSTASNEVFRVLDDTGNTLINETSGTGERWRKI